MSVEAPTQMPTYRQIARKMAELAVERGQWSGFPIPIEGLDLHLEPRFPHRLDTIRTCDQGDPSKMLTVVNRWFDSRLRVDVIITRDLAGRLGWSFAFHNPVDFLIGTIGAATGWLLEAEYTAQDKLHDMISDHKMSQYLLSGAFMETSKRSGVTYVFRKLRPTVALKADRRGHMRILAALCLHPVGYYKGSWAGCQTPTDDVVAHLCMMRGDEPKFWANANQHPATDPASGL